MPLCWTIRVCLVHPTLDTFRHLVGDPRGSKDQSEGLSLLDLVKHIAVKETTRDPSRYVHVFILHPLLDHTPDLAGFIH